MTPRQVVKLWVEAFNNADHLALAKLYHEDAINHQMPFDAVVGREEIENMFKREFAAVTMVCIPEQILEDGEWAVLEWTDPKDFRGCGFFQIKENRIVLQRGYWDKLTFNKLYALPIK